MIMEEKDKSFAEDLESTRSQVLDNVIQIYAYFILLSDFSAILVEI